MKADTVYKQITDALGYLTPEDAEHLQRLLRPLLDACRAEIAAAGMQAKDKDRFAAALSFAKTVQKQYKRFRPAIAGAWTTPDGVQAITDTYLLVMYDKPFDGLPEIPADATPIDIKPLLTDDTTSNGTFPRVQDLKTALKLAKLDWTGSAKEFRHYTWLKDNIYVQTQLLITAIECTGCTEYRYGTPVQPIRGRNEKTGAAFLLCPVRVTAETLKGNNIYYPDGDSDIDFLIAKED